MGFHFGDGGRVDLGESANFLNGIRLGVVPGWRKRSSRKGEGVILTLGHGTGRDQKAS